METLNQKYNIAITVLSPLSIGAGVEKDWVKGTDFVIKDKILYRLNLKKMIQSGIDAQRLSTSFAKKNAKEILLIIGNKLEKVSDKTYTFPVDTDNDVKSFIKNELSGNPIIPGSSLKGAIRSIIFKYLKDDNYREPKEKDYFGSAKEGDELMRFIKFSDSEFQKTELVNTKIFNLFKKGNEWNGGWKHERRLTNSQFDPMGFNTIYEAIPPNEQGVCTIMMSDIAFNKIGSHKDKYKGKKEKLFNLNYLFQTINEHTKEYIGKEITFFEKYATEKSDIIVDSLKEILNRIPYDNSSCILKMAAGSGFHSITGDWQYDNYTKIGIERNEGGIPKYKSRKVAIYNEKFYLMGFVSLRQIDEEEIDRIQKAKEAEAQEKVDKERMKQECLALEKQKMVNYENTIQQAKVFYNEEEYIKSIESFEKAKSILPEGKEHREFIAEIQKILDREKEKEELKEMNRQIELSKQIKSQIPLSERLQPIQKIPTLIGGLKTWMKWNNEYLSNGCLSNNDIDVLRKQIFYIYSLMNKRDKELWQNINKWRELSDIIDEDEVNKIIKELKKLNTKQ
ncbi:hypothetical protein EZS27_010515 [termite gut metagenome]|uniref:CRISPR system Cms protein Csm5 n=1 Tax=termite gut metagenome TaxID=433724 RepID=A0A5J4S6J1_9ZZZZ